MEQQTLDLMEPIAAQIRVSLRHDIVTLARRPGAILSESEVAKQFEVSRQPVREAFIQLQSEGLVQVLPHRGTVVMPISEIEVENAVFLREAIETRVVEQLATTPGESKTVLGRLLEDQRTANKQGSKPFDYLADDEFHRALMVLIGREGAWRQVVGIKAQMDRVRFLEYRLSPVNHEEILQNHEGIAAAVAAGDKDEAVLRMSRHIMSNLDDLTTVRTDFPELFQSVHASFRRSKAQAETV